MSILLEISDAMVDPGDAIDVTRASDLPVHGIQAHAAGRMRRMISLDHRGPGVVVGWLEDHFHHFGVTIEHDGAHVRDIRTASPRYPWATCPGTIGPLRALIGKPLIRRASELGSLIDMRRQCTHVFDLTSLVMVQAATRRPDRVYEAIVDDRPVVRNPAARAANEMNNYGAGSVSLKLDGHIAMEWQLDDRSITGPAPYGGHSLEAGFRAWTEAMPEEEAEYATIMRRAILVAGGRYADFGLYRSAADQNMPPVCYAYQPERVAEGLRVPDSIRNYERSSATMLSHRHETP
jgi:hypothetical protein